MKPSQFLQDMLQCDVRVRLNDGSDYFGKLIAVDGFMNVGLQNCKDSQITFLRGNNVFHISPSHSS